MNYYYHRYYQYASAHFLTKCVKSSLLKEPSGETPHHSYRRRLLSQVSDNPIWAITFCSQLRIVVALLWSILKLVFRYLYIFSSLTHRKDTICPRCFQNVTYSYSLNNKNQNSLEQPNVKEQHNNRRLLSNDKTSLPFCLCIRSITCTWLQSVYFQMCVRRGGRDIEKNQLNTNATLWTVLMAFRLFCRSSNALAR